LVQFPDYDEEVKRLYRILLMGRNGVVPVPID
jgi:hypothetical protein